MIGWYFCISLGIILGVTTCLEMLTFTGVTNSSKIMFLSVVIVSLAKVAYSTRSTCIKYTGTKGTSTKNVGIVDTYIRKTCTKDACSSTKSIYTKVTSDKCACIQSFYTIEYLRIY